MAAPALPPLLLLLLLFVVYEYLVVRHLSVWQRLRTHKAGCNSWHLPFHIAVQHSFNCTSQVRWLESFLL